MVRRDPGYLGEHVCALTLVSTPSQRFVCDGPRRGATGRLSPPHRAAAGPVCEARMPASGSSSVFGRQGAVPGPLPARSPGPGGSARPPAAFWEG